MQGLLNVRLLLSLLYIIIYSYEDLVSAVVCIIVKIFGDT